MPATKPVLAACFAVVLGYGAYPYVTLYQLNQAIHRGDAHSLQQLVNWPAVRDGIKQDLAGADAAPRHDLPGFGASFVHGIADRAVDQQVTPQALAAAVHRAGPISAQAADLHVSWAFFDDPTHFMVDLNASHAAPIRVQLQLRDGQWQVTRVWLPRVLLDRANARV